MVWTACPLSSMESKSHVLPQRELLRCSTVALASSVNSLSQGGTLHAKLSTWF
jgi:hypothetical protein